MLNFKSISKDDLEQIRKWRTSPEVTHFMYSSPDISSEDQIKWFESLASNKSCEYKLITYKDKNIGVIYLTDIDQKANRCEWGLYIGETKYQGLGAIASFKWIEYAFYEREFNKLSSFVLDYNKSSLKLTESFGFREVGYYIDHCFKDGQYHNMVGFELLKRDWDIIRLNYKNKLKL